MGNSYLFFYKPKYKNNTSLYVAVKFTLILVIKSECFPELNLLTKILVMLAKIYSISPFIAKYKLLMSAVG